LCIVVYCVFCDVCGSSVLRCVLIYAWSVCCECALCVVMWTLCAWGQSFGVVCYVWVLSSSFFLYVKLLSCVSCLCGSVL